MTTRCHACVDLCKPWDRRRDQPFCDAERESIAQCSIVVGSSNVEVLKCR
jgi:hypothetical protein